MKKVFPSQVSSEQVTKGDPDKLRCPHCKHTATRVPDGKGGTYYRCPSCSRTFR